ncbi:FAD-dependent oxidoreductase [Alkalibacter mobilis]|uniref:FAD-dependent oxidoreductase n=1 Tax=Alkalibacter mobilis TaxID=2787712 RepID=UPI00189D5B2B|nr:FAD-dependent oxidoreductase [Alkalibacter mobilis]MBF7096774.1 FAD-dependent oxidoreductase [Alkalibacter mobilis]
MEKKGVSRRDFIKGAAVGTIGVATMGIFGACSQEGSGNTTKDIKWDKETEVLVVGAGGTGVAAAAQASIDGAAVLILEKAGIAGGTTNYSGGVMQAAGTEFQKNLTSFKNDTAENHFQLWLRAGEGLVDEELVKDLAYGAADHISWLSGLGLNFTSVYGHCNIPYVDKNLFADRIHVYEGGGGHGGGVPLVQAMLNTALDKGAVIEYETEVTDLIANDDGEVIGVVANQGGKALNIKAKKGVILAAAGVDNNKEMAKELAPQQYWSLNNGVPLCAETDTGDGIRMAMEIGAAVCGFGGTIDFCGKTGAATDNRVPMFPSFIVNKQGRRFVSEDATYAFHYRAIFQQESQFGAPTYMIFGESSLSDEFARWTTESLEKDIADGVVIKGATIEELAQKIDVDAVNLAATLSTWNSDANSGSDNQFDRETGIKPISGPFYAYKNVAFNLGAIGGVKINTDAQAIDTDGEIIPRLYAGGLNAGGWLGPYYPGSGTAIIGTVHWGRKAGAHAAKLTSL